MQARKFKNFTTEDFTWKFDGVPFTFKAGQEIYLEEDKALHFAKHLVDRELNRLNVESGLHGTGKEVPTNNQKERAKFEVQCFPSDEIVTPLEALNLNVEAEKEANEEEFPDLKKKKVTPKKDIV